MKRFPLSAVLTSLPLDFGTACARAAALGFSHADVDALADRPPAHFEALADSGLLVACAALGRDLPPGHGLDAPLVAVRRATLDFIKCQVADAATLGATRASLVPGTDASPEALLRFAEGLALLADHAARRGVRLCLEPAPGRALATAGAALDWVESSAVAGVSLLLDVGKCLRSAEEPAEVARRAGRRLGHVRCPADAAGEVLGRLLTQLDAGGYDGALALALDPSPADLLASWKAIRTA